MSRLIPAFILILFFLHPWYGIIALIGTAILLIILWARNGGLLDRNGIVSLGLVLIGLLAVFAMRGRRKN